MSDFGGAQSPNEAEGEGRWVLLQPFVGPWADDDRNANFKQQVAIYSKSDPMTTLDRMSRSQDIPVGALARYVLAKWAASGSDGLLEIGPMVVRQMQQVVDRAESEGTPEAQLAAYESLRQIISWLAVPLEKSE
jgi:hypothetical protein